jgi:hypothetical protein
MYAQKVAVHFADGTEKDVVLSQWSMGQFAQYAARSGLAVDIQNPGLMGVVMLRYQAYCELHRDPTTARPSFDKWDFTVQEVEPITEAEPVDPTQPVPSGGSSESSP